MFIKYIFFIVSIPLLAIAIFFLKQGEGKKARYLSYIFISTATWNFFEGLSLIMTDDKLQIFFHEFKYVGISTLPVFTFLFVLLFLNRDNKIARNHALLFIVPVLTLLMILTNPKLHFFRKAIWVQHSMNCDMVLTKNNWGFYLSLLYFYILILITVILIISKWLNTPKIYRNQLSLILVGLFLPMISNFTYVILGFTAKTIDPTPLLFTITAFTTFHCTYRFKFMNINPIAREYVFKNMPSPIIVVDPTERIIDLNDYAEEIFETNLSLVSGKNLKDLNIVLSEDGINKVKMADKTYLINRSPITDSSRIVIGTAIILYDITMQEGYLNQLEYLSFHDSLTGLYNRNFYNKLCEEFDTVDNLPLGIIFGDLNGLKETNDTYGHDKGDEALRIVANALKTSMPPGSYSMRLGGDEFCSFIPNISEAELNRIITNVHSSIENNKTFNHISISIGYAIKYSFDEDLQRLITLADDRMYKNKYANK